MSERFAIYYAPAATGALWEKASTWLGRDAASGDQFNGPVAGIDRDRLLNLTQSANRYGFHATIKAPMALADGTSVEALREQLAEFAGRHQPVELGPMKVALLGGFLALIPESAGRSADRFCRLCGGRFRSVPGADERQGPCRARRPRG